MANIRTKLLIGFMLVGLISLLVVTLSSINTIRKGMEQEISNGLLRLAEAEEGQVFAYLYSLESRTVDFSSDGFIRDSLKEIVNKDSAQAVEALNQYLINNKKPLDENIFCIMVLDLTGKIVASTDIEEVGTDESSTEQFIEGKKGAYTGEEIGEEEVASPETFLSVSAPITDKDSGELLGVIVISYHTKKLEEILSGEFQLEKGALSSDIFTTESLEIHIVDKEKKVLAHGHKKAEKTLLNVIDTLPVQKCINEKKEMIGKYINHWGGDVVGASMCIPARGWAILVEIKSEEAFISINKIYYDLLSVVIIVFLSVLFSAWILSAAITDPIKKLTEVIESMSKGKIDAEIGSKLKESNDEIGDLARAFDRVAKTVKLAVLEKKEEKRGKNEKQ